MLSDHEYVNTEYEDWPYRNINNYVRSLLIPTRMDKVALGAYFDGLYQNDANWLARFNESYPLHNRLQSIYVEDRTAFLEELQGLESFPEIITASLEASPSLSPLSFASKLNQATTPVSDLSQVLEYNNFYLSEHHLYGSSRLGIKTWWPSQYAYTWDAAKSVADNNAAMAASEFGYRRPWYSRVYNSLISYDQTLPYGNALTSSLYSERTIGQKHYELTNHLGNVMAVVTDKVTNVKADANAALPALAVKRASLSAAYDYYPFGMQMPERSVEDASVQCIPVTHTRYVSKTILDHEVIVRNTSALTFFTASPGVSINYHENGSGGMIPGGAPEITLPEDMGFVFAMQTDNPDDATEMSLELPAAGVDKEMRLRTYIVNHKSAEDKETYGGEGVAVSLWQEADGEEHLLGQQYVYFESEIDLPFTSLSSADIRISFMDATAKGAFSVSTVQLLKKDVVADNYVVLTCNTDELGKSDYRFGFNGQQKDNEISGAGNHNTAQFWEYDTRLGRRWNLDPVDQIDISNYAVNENNPILNSDPNGDQCAALPKQDNRSLWQKFLDGVYGLGYSIADDAAVSMIYVHQQTDPQSPASKMTKKVPHAQGVPASIRTGLLFFAPESGEVRTGNLARRVLTGAEDGAIGFRGSVRTPSPSAAPKPSVGFFKFSGDALETSSGLKLPNMRNYKIGFQTSTEHVFRHTVDDLTRSYHGVFDRSGSQLIMQLDDAFAQAQAIHWDLTKSSETVGNVTRKVKWNGNIDYTIETGARVGYQGGSKGSRSALTKIQMGTTPNNELITAFPQ